MSKKMNTMFGRRAWNVLRLALLWARKGGAFKRGIMMEIRLLLNYIKCLCHSNAHGSIQYNEKEFSFDKTPLFDFKKMHRPNSMRFNIPCLKPQVDFDYDINDFYGEKERYEEYKEESICDEVVEVAEEEGIDSKAEEFIAKFYQQMKLQRQISYLEYNVESQGTHSCDSVHSFVRK